MFMVDGERTVKLSKTVAFWIFNLGRRLVREGVGNAGWDPRVPITDFLNDDDAPGFIDEFELGTPGYSWAEAAISLIRFLVGVVANEFGPELPFEPRLLIDDQENIEWHL